MSTYRESAQFIDALRQHYRRLDGLLVKHRDRLGPIDVWEFNHPVIALRKLLFGGVGDPNWSAEDVPKAPKDPPSPEEIETRRLRIVPMSVHDPESDDREPPEVA